MRRSRPSPVLYHATRADFEVFDTAKGDLGAHFGSAAQANHIAMTRLAGVQGARIIPVRLTLRNPLRLRDVGSFHADGIALQLEKLGLLAKGEGRRIHDACAANWRMRKHYDPLLRQLIEQAGYDGVVYRNNHEGPGDSFIAFHAHQIAFALEGAAPGAGDAMARSVITEDGRQGSKPRVVYHGSPHHFDVFRVSAFGSFGRGIYFSSSLEQAYLFGGQREDTLIVQAHLALSCPYQHRIKEPQVVDLWGEGLVQEIFEPEHAHALLQKALHSSQAFGDEICLQLQAMGHDGIVATYSDGTQELVAFSPDQVRMAAPTQRAQALMQALPDLTYTHTESPTP